MSDFYYDHIGFNLSKNKLQLVEVTFQGEDFIVQNINEVFFEEPISFDEVRKSKFISQLQSAYDELNILQPVNSVNASFALPTEMFKIIQLPIDPDLSYTDCQEQLRWELKTLYPEVDDANLAIQFFALEPNFSTNHLSAIVLALGRDKLQLLTDFSRSTGLELKFIENAHFSTDRLLFFSTEIADGLSLSVFYSNLHITAEVFQNGELLFLKSAKLANVGRIMDFLENNIFIRPGMNRHDFQTLFFTGDNLSNSAIQKIEAGLLTQFKRYNTFDNFIWKVEPSSLKNINFHGSNFAPAAGVALRLE